MAGDVIIVGHFFLSYIFSGFCLARGRSLKSGFVMTRRTKSDEASALRSPRGLVDAIDRQQLLGVY